MNKLILGTVQFGLEYGINNSNGKPHKKEVFKILDYAFNHGIRLLDTADAYGNATDIIGEYHRLYPNKFDIITKFKTNGSDKFDLNQIVQNTLTRLDIDEIWGYLYHSFSDYLAYPQILSQLVKFQQKGLIQNIGLSIYNNNEFEQAIENEYINIIQLPYNLLDNDNRRGKLIRKAKENNKIIHTRSAFLQGLFFKEPHNLSKKLSPLASSVGMLQDLTKDYQEDMAALALKYAVSNPHIDNVLIGVDTMEQLQNNLNNLNNKDLPPAFIHQIDSIAVENTALLNPANWS